jgi:hypothetical protein
MGSLDKLQLIHTDIEVAKKVMDVVLGSSRRTLSLSIEHTSGPLITLLKHSLTKRVFNLQLLAGENLPLNSEKEQTVDDLKHSIWGYIGQRLERLDGFFPSCHYL